MATKTGSWQQQPIQFPNHKNSTQGFHPGKNRGVFDWGNIQLLAVCFNKK